MPREIDWENPYTRMIIKQKVLNWLSNIPDYVSSTANAKQFQNLTGLSQAALLKNWAGKDGVRGTKDDGRLTSCNGFAGHYSLAILGAKLKAGLFMFPIMEFLVKAGMPEAWKSQTDDPSARPGFGDLVRWNRLHVGVSLGFEGGKWHTIEGGKGGPSSNFDAVARVTYDQYPQSEIKGWADFAAIYDHDLK